MDYLSASEVDEIGPINPKLPVIPILSLDGQASNKDTEDHLRAGEKTRLSLYSYRL